MLSIAPIAGGGAGYYAAQDNYYFLGNLQSRWIGEGAQALGLHGAVEAHQLDELIAGRLPNGESLEHMSGGKNVHRSGYDLTFSAPKSVSVLIALYGESRLLDAHNRAVETVSKEIEAMVGTRVMSDGISQHVQTGKMVAATFNHDTSRNLDPQIHTHLLLLNMTEKDGRWSTLSSDRKGRSGTIDVLYDNKIALGQIYRHELRRQVEAMGYETVNTGRRGLWEIRDIPVDIFSTRSQEIRDAVGEDASARSRSVAALDTRQAKQKEPDRDELLTEWHERIDRTGFSYPAFREKVRTREAQLRAESVRSVAEKTFVNCCLLILRRVICPCPVNRFAALLSPLRVQKRTAQAPSQAPAGLAPQAKSVGKSQTKMKRMQRNVCAGNAVRMSVKLRFRLHSKSYKKPSIMGWRENLPNFQYASSEASQPHNNKGLLRV